jgi:hypothetical protein
MRMALPRLIAVHGVKRSGKGTTADYLVSRHGYSVIKQAGPLKDMLTVLLASCGYPHETVFRCIEGDLKEIPLPALGGKSGRYSMQTLGTEWRDLFSPLLWSGITCRRIRANTAAGGRIVVDDLRFPHEPPPLAAEGAVFWRVTSDRPADAGGLADTAGALAGGRDRLDLGDGVLWDMVRALLGHCCLEGDALDAAIDGPASGIPLEALCWKSPGYAFETLKRDWAAMMAAPWEPVPAATASHVSERGLPPEMFGVHLRNDSSFAYLHAQIEAALAGGGACAAA